jgi:hypothetical protein
MIKRNRQNLGRNEDRLNSFNIGTNEALEIFLGRPSISEEEHIRLEQIPKLWRSSHAKCGLFCFASCATTVMIHHQLLIRVDSVDRRDSR